MLIGTHYSFHVMLIGFGTLLSFRVTLIGTLLIFYVTLIGKLKFSCHVDLVTLELSISSLLNCLLHDHCLFIL